MGNQACCDDTIHNAAELPQADKYVNKAPEPPKKIEPEVTIPILSQPIMDHLLIHSNIVFENRTILE